MAFSSETAPFRGRRVLDPLARHLQKRRGLLTVIYQTVITIFLYLPFVLVPAFRIWLVIQKDQYIYLDDLVKEADLS